MKKTPMYEDGEYKGHFECTGKPKAKRSLREVIQAHKRAERDARLVQLLAR